MGWTQNTGLTLNMQKVFFYSLPKHFKTQWLTIRIPSPLFLINIFEVLFALVLKYLFLSSYLQGLIIVHLSYHGITQSYHVLSACVAF